MPLTSIQFLLNVSCIQLPNGAAVLNYISNSKLVSIDGILFTSNSLVNYRINYSYENVTHILAQSKRLLNRVSMLDYKLYMLICLSASNELPFPVWFPF